METIKIFLLEPIQDKKFDAVIIWSDNELDARNNAKPVRPAGGKGEVEPENIEDLFFYSDSTNATCRELNNAECKIKNQIDNEVEIVFKGILYYLTKNEPEIISH